MVDRLSWIDASNQFSFVLKRTDLTMKLIEWNYLSIFEFNLICTSIIHVLYCYFSISHTFFYDVPLFSATTFAFFYYYITNFHSLNVHTFMWYFVTFAISLFFLFLFSKSLVVFLKKKCIWFHRDLFLMFPK